MAATNSTLEKKDESSEEKGGELLFCGATSWDIVGRRKGVEGNLLSPTRLRPLLGVNIRFVASGCASCHCVALDVEGRCYTWGRNEKGQLGHGDMIQRDRPTVVSGLSKYKIVKAGAGRNHTVVVSDEGRSFAFGWNKHGQLGLGTAKNGFVSVEVESSPVPCVVSDEVTSIACGADFTVWLSSTEGASILTAGLPQYGQLGHGTDNEFNMKDGSVKLAYEAQPRPKAIASLAGETIVKVACGANHTVAVDKNGFVYTWGFGGYGRLGHREQKDEWSPRRIDVFQRNNVLPPNAIVSAGSANSACTAGGGQLYMWGKIKNNGDDWMYPKPMMDLSGWNLRWMDSGSMHHFVGADSSCISWGHAQYGELGYGPHGQKSSAAPKKVDILEGMHVMGVACGFCHSMVIVDRTEDIADRLEQLEIYDGKGSLEETVEQPKEETVATTTKQQVPAKRGRKRKAAKASSDSEQDSGEENSDKEKEAKGSDSDYSEDGEEEANGKKQTTRGRGRGRGGRGRGGRTGNGKASPVKTGRGRGRPRKF
ncbi:protein RCC2-like [Brassica rapa]|uniref:UVB-resistance protein UVR8 n=1 Tax=Brassica campestris TaxID=3711 RepID=A8IXV7_BRACM|nr:protein RCC2-like [Brassica rapa]ABV89658.1 UVB-resistance protein UVR8 [Brassica rapa]